MNKEKEIKKPYSISISGGYGRVLSAVGVINELKNRNPDTEINVITGYPEVFINNPNINKVYSLNHEYLYDDHIKGTIYLEPEPYKLQGYIEGDLHITNGFAKEIIGEDKFYKPELYLSEEELAEAEAFSKSVTKPIVLFQPFGSMGGRTKDGKTILNDPSFRSIPLDFAKKIYDELSKDYQVILIKEQNQAGLEGWITMPPMPLRKIAALVKFSKGIVACDSSLQHICGAIGKKAFVLWGSTNYNQLGYESNINLYSKQHVTQYNPVRMPGNDYDAEKRYKNVWNYINNSTLNKIKEYLENEN
jgi:ADP-heptose:LPS heptosyltransferase